MTVLAICRTNSISCSITITAGADAGKNTGMEELKKELQEIRKQLSNRQKAQEK
ncbi:MAG: hypothetical protein H0Z54_04255 [Nitrospira sp.]|nr:hypothetical protein [Nitrospira sp.]